MTFDQSVLHNIRHLNNHIFVTLPNSFKVKVHIVGSMHLSTYLELDNVFFIPSFKYNLLSVYRLCDQFDCDVIFAKLCCAIEAPSMKKEPLFGEANAGLYVMRSNTSQKHLASQQPVISVQHSNVVANVPSPMSSVSFQHSVCPRTLCHNVLNLVCNTISTINKSIYVPTIMCTVKLWHYRFGHLPYNAMKNIKSVSLSSHYFLGLELVHEGVDWLLHNASSHLSFSQSLTV